MRRNSLIGLLLFLGLVTVEMIGLGFNFGLFYLPLTYGWERKTHSAEFSPRDTAEVIQFQDKVFISNGFNNDIDPVCMRDLWVSTNGVNWALALDNTPYDAYAEMVVHKDKIYAVKDSVWVSDYGFQWERILESTPFGKRSYGELVSWQGYLWQLGSGEDVWRSSDGIEWECVLAKAPWANRFGASVVVWRDKLWLFGGGNDIVVWNTLDGKAWNMAGFVEWNPRRWAVPVVLNDRLYLISGYDLMLQENCNEVWSTDDGAKWKRLQVPWKSRHEVSAWIQDGKIWMAAGNAYPLLNDVWTYGG